MLELLFGFVAGTAATSWLHWKARRRSSGPKEADKRPSEAPFEGTLNGAMRVAIIFMSMPPEIAARLFNHMSPEDVELVTTQITQLPAISPSLRQKILAEFSASLGIAEARLEEAAHQEPALIASALATLATLSPR